ncbi:MAG TPA: LON peptidase substrate-binding domain-containing protein [Steroidobacteraceae bacterium]|jgi:Lon protease-like protein|nr:LON peptidase substrate-binding domain-containing protein [Steroidobacteraceae bacterium]
MTAHNSVIALFPLHTVLFPGGPLPLRIFETRYTDMVRRCMREQQPFGVVLIREGEEAGAVASTADVGCSARIADFHRLQDGLLGISCVGERKFRVQRVWRAPDGLNMAEVTWLEPERELALPPQYARIGATVRRALGELAAQYQHVEKKFEDAGWVGARLSELLPIEPADKQALLELDDPIARLDALLRLVPDGAVRSGAGEGDS